MARARLDVWMVNHGLIESREKAQALIMAGEVLLNGQKAAKPGQSVPPDARVELLARPRFVSRGGLKLEGALDGFRIDVTGFICADFGSSTGGFTDCLLQRGAAKVYAIDVGANQLDWRLANDPRVVVRQGVNARYLDETIIPELVDLCVCDVSFISATMIIPSMIGVLKPAGSLLVLVKPQFEVGREQVGKGGIVRETELHRWACGQAQTFVEKEGFRTAMMESPITGAEGNREFFLHAHR